MQLLNGIFPSLAAAALWLPMTAELQFEGETWPPFRTGEELLADCQSENDAQLAECRGYISGIADVLGGSGARVDGLRSCPDRGWGGSENLVKIVVDFLEENPELRSIKADGLVSYALSLNFPCVQP